MLKGHKGQTTFELLIILAAITFTVVSFTGIFVSKSDDIRALAFAKEYALSNFCIVESQTLDKNEITLTIKKESCSITPDGVQAYLSEKNLGGYTVEIRGE
ncbi:MAG: hypothetical protein QW735_01515 [archaeon]